MTYRLLNFATVYYSPLPGHLHSPQFKLDLRSGREVHFKDQLCCHRSSLPAVLLVPEDFLLMTPPPTDNANRGTTGAGAGTVGAKNGTGTTGTTADAAGDALHGGTGTVPKTNATGSGTSAAAAASSHSSVSCASLAGPFPPADSAGVLQITPAMLQQLVASATAASSSNPREPPVLKFWESEAAVWFQVFHWYYQQRNLTQLALLNALLPLAPASAVSLCRPYVGSAAPDVFDQVERLLLQRFEMSPRECGKAHSECTSLGDRTPEEMLQYMRSLQPGEQEGDLFRYFFVSLLPDVVREVVASMDSLDDMAKTANNILQSNAAAHVYALRQANDTV